MLVSRVEVHRGRQTETSVVTVVKSLQLTQTVTRAWRERQRAVPSCRLYAQCGGVPVARAVTASATDLS